MGCDWPTGFDEQLHVALRLKLARGAVTSRARRARAPMEDSDDERKQHELEVLERLLTPVQVPLPAPSMPRSAPAHPMSAPPAAHLSGAISYGQPFVSPASAYELYGLTPSGAPKDASEVGMAPPELVLPALALPDALASDALMTAPANGAPDRADASAALRYVAQKERGALEHLLTRAANLDQCTTSAARLRAALRVREAPEARLRLEKALGRWVVHDYTPSTEVYEPARAEPEILRRANKGGDVYAEFDRSIRIHAEAQKDRLKVVLDKRRAALHGVLNDRHAKAVNNQKTAHLSKFLAAQTTQATDNLVKWLIAHRYGN